VACSGVTFTLPEVKYVLIHFSKWLLMGQQTGDGNDGKNRVFPLEQRQIEDLKDRMAEELYVDMSHSVGSGWKLR